MFRHIRNELICQACGEDMDLCEPEINGIHYVVRVIPCKTCMAKYKALEVALKSVMGNERAS